MVAPPSILIRAPHRGERAWIERQLVESWDSTIVASRGRVHDASSLPALVAVQGDELVGLATFAMVYSPIKGMAGLARRASSAAPRCTATSLIPRR